MAKKVVDEVAALLPEVEVGRFKVRPWSFGRFKKVYPALLSLIPALVAIGLTDKNFQEVLDSKPEVLIGAILPSISGLIAGTLDITEEEVDALGYDEVVALGITIIGQNISRLKNSLPLIMEQIKAVTRGI